MHNWLTSLSFTAKPQHCTGQETPDLYAAGVLLHRMGSWVLRCWTPDHQKACNPAWCSDFMSLVPI